MDEQIFTYGAIELHAIHLFRKSSSIYHQGRVRYSWRHKIAERRMICRSHRCSVYLRVWPAMSLRATTDRFRRTDWGYRLEARRA